MKNAFMILVVLCSTALAESVEKPERSPLFGFVNAIFAGYEEPALRAPIRQTTGLCPRTVKVAVIDTGIDYEHPELVNSLLLNQGESGPTTVNKQPADKAANARDDDQNGFVDDVLGWDFVHRDNKPYDTHGHGTHIAGLVLSAAKELPLGCTPDVQILALKYYDNSGSGYDNLTNTVKSFKYAINAGVDIINYSGGGSEPAESEKEMVKLASSQGILVIAASGNDGRNNDKIPYFPASYNYENVIAVGGHNKLNRLTPSSNYGSTSVHVAAPGLMVISTLPGGRKGTMSGTSQATGITSGVFAGLLSLQATKDVQAVKQAVFSTATAPVDAKEKLLIYGLINGPEAVKVLKK